MDENSITLLGPYKCCQLHPIQIQVLFSGTITVTLLSTSKRDLQTELFDTAYSKRKQSA